MANFRFGKHPPQVDYRTLRFKSYLKSSLPAPPASFNALTRVYQDLHQNNPGILFPIDGNDTLGDCTIAAVAHSTTVYNSFVDKKDIPNLAAVQKLYFHLTGGPDTGLNELDVLNYWRETGAFGQKILAYVKIVPKDHVHIQQAIQMFGGVYLGFQVQQNCIQEFNNKQPWTPGPLTNDGHAVFAVAYDPNTVTVLTWGSTQQGTWDWWDECVDEAYAILPQAAAKAGFAPGFDIKQLQADLAQVAN
jgi:hypothetical protein